jgi:cell division protein FtsZ
MIQFDLPKEQSSIIKVIGVGGGGSNAVNHMFSQDIEGVNFVICNTDAQAIALSKVPNKIQLGPHLTQGLGAGANPEIGRQATEESLEEIRRILEVNTKMVFITAGMGGGTGTGGAPIVAKICKDLGILTVGIVTTPFSYEGKKRIQQAEEGISTLKQYVDTLLVISNDKLRHQFGNLTMRAAFSKADNVLATAAKCITDVINSTGQINVDFADVCTVMRKGGVAILGSATVNGENRAQRAIEQALNSPLLNDNDIRGAKWILININSAEGEHEFTMDEVEIIQNYLLSNAGENTDVILGMGYDNMLADNIGITLIATGFDHKDPFEGAMIPEKKKPEEEKIVMTLGIDGEETKLYGQPVLPFEEKDPFAPKLVDTESSLHTPETQLQHTMPQAEEKPEVYMLSMPEEAPVVEQPRAEMQQPKVAVEMPKPVAEQPKVVAVMPVAEKPVGKEVEAEQVTSIELTVEENSVEIEMHYLSSSPQVPTENLTVENQSGANTTPFDSKDNKEASATRTSGGFLAKPSNIYAEEPMDLKSKQETPVEEPVTANVDEDGPIFDMQLVIKETNTVDEPGTPPVHATLGSTISVEEPAMQDEAEDQKRKAAERLHKLRNLSFNINAADPNNEFESVPAYVRRNLEMHNTALTSVEKFYSKYTVKSDDNNQGQISSLNSFLDGKKPD